MGKTVSSKHAAKLARKVARKAVRFQEFYNAYNQLSNVGELLKVCGYMVDGSFIGSSDPDLEGTYFALEARLTDLVGEVDTVSKMLEAKLCASENDEVVS